MYDPIALHVTEAFIIISVVAIIGGALLAVKTRRVALATNKREVRGK